MDLWLHYSDVGLSVFWKFKKEIILDFAYNMHS